MPPALSTISCGCDHAPSCSVIAESAPPAWQMSAGTPPAVAMAIAVTPAGAGTLSSSDQPPSVRRRDWSVPPEP